MHTALPWRFDPIFDKCHFIQQALYIKSLRQIYVNCTAKMINILYINLKKINLQPNESKREKLHDKDAYKNLLTDSKHFYVTCIIQH